MIHKEVLATFMARPEFFAASVKVREEFIKHDEEHSSGLGELPEQMLQPEEAAELEMEPPQGELPQQ
jgi:hypothetical protein